MIRRASTLAAASLAFAGALSSLAPSDARACGGGFFPSEPVPGMIESASVVTDHRMAVAITPTMTTLWDQIEYAGDPSEFAWVLPVRGGVTVGVGSDDFLTALDKETAPEIVAPRRRCARPNNGGCNGSNTEGCASSDSAEEFGFEDGFQEDSGVFVTGRQLVGPYAAVTVHGDDESAILGFLRGNKFNVPTTIQPTLSKFVTEGFDFVVVRLRRKAGVHAMVPIRVSWKGATLSLPLRMVQAGVAGNVGIKLFVISDQRYTAANYPTFSVDPSGLTWDFPEQKSDYVTIRDQMAADFDGRAFSLEASIFVPRTSLPAIKPDQPLPPTDDAGVDTAPEDAADGGDAAVDDAASDAVTDAAPEEVATDTGPKPEYDGGSGPAIDPYDSDLNIAYGTFQLRRVTRLRGNLPAKYLDQDLVLALDVNQGVLSRKIQVDRATSAPVCPGTASIAGEEKDLPIRASVAIVLGALGAVLARRASRRA